MKGFVFPDDLRYDDIIVVSGESEARTVLQDFEDFGWRWASGKNSCNAKFIPDIFGISVRNLSERKIGYFPKPATVEELRPLYKRVLIASEIFPDPDFSELDLSGFLEEADYEN